MPWFLLSRTLCIRMASHPRKFIAQPTEDDLKKYPDAVRHLVKKGREQRYVTHQEIIAAIPNAEEHVDLLDDVYSLFVDLGIEVIDVKDALIWQKKNKKMLAVMVEPTEDLAKEVTTDDTEDEDEEDEEKVADNLTSDMSQEDDSLMQVVATAGIAIDEKGLSDEEKKKRRREREVDLVEISPQAKPPVVKLLNYDKYRYQQEKAAQEARKKVKKVTMKGIRLSVRIGTNDVNFKVKQTGEFLTEGNKVKVDVVMRGREQAHPELAFDLIKRFQTLITIPFTKEVGPSRMGNMVSIIIGPVSKN